MTLPRRNYPADFLLTPNKNLGHSLGFEARCWFCVNKKSAGQFLRGSVYICIRFGARFKALCKGLASSFGGAINWINNCRYLGVYFVVDVSLNVVLIMLKVNFSGPSTLYLARLDALLRKKLS